MKKGTKVKVNLNLEDANKLGIRNALMNKEGVVGDAYTLGHFINIEGKNYAIANKYNAMEEITE